MDIVTHGLLGALVAQSISRSRNLRIATLIGGVVALLPDLDVLIQHERDPLLVLEYHRHFTHSLLFAPLPALLITLLMAPLVRQDLSRVRLFMLGLLAYASACLLDACTSYGTHLLWPLADEPLSLSIIAVVDPLFTLILLIAVIIAWRAHDRQKALIGLAVAGAYLLLGWAQQQRALEAASALATERQLSPVQVQAKPTLGNILLWRSVAVTTDHHIQVDAIHVSFSTRIYPGERRALINPKTWDQVTTGSRAQRDLLRYQQINHPLLVAHSQDPRMIGDARYAMLPTSADPLWGLEINPQQQDQPSALVTHRQLTPAMRQAFTDMLLGRSLSWDE